LTNCLYFKKKFSTDPFLQIPIQKDPKIQNTKRTATMGHHGDTKSALNVSWWQLKT